VEREKNFLASGIHWWPKFFLDYSCCIKRIWYICIYIYVYVYIWRRRDCIWVSLLTNDAAHTKQKRRDVTGWLNKLFKNAVNHFDLSHPVIIFTITIIIYNYNIIITNNDDVRLQDPILLLQIPISTSKNFSDHYRQFEHALSKTCANSDLGSRLPVLEARRR
jgi:hypothetical protein